ncbi:hypothetical protein [Sphingomonas xinjiangensis]|uniref:Uncharacterized protein n=1 Tax=Sphingomonas xinjiangensis TaxID=643568 RepID=A0A840YTS2_9SPHN|nr:hypothetical protein [Sphingomonas xinjiangensis]MBB5713119.1 hypothetical protein [Sphingomonas xinjiangensis]
MPDLFTKIDTSTGDDRVAPKFIVRICNRGPDHLPERAFSDQLTRFMLDGHALTNSGPAKLCIDDFDARSCSQAYLTSSHFAR